MTKCLHSNYLDIRGSEVRDFSTLTVGRWYQIEVPTQNAVVFAQYVEVDNSTIVFQACTEDAHEYGFKRRHVAHDNLKAKEITEHRRRVYKFKQVPNAGATMITPPHNFRIGQLVVHSQNFFANRCAGKKPENYDSAVVRVVGFSDDYIGIRVANRKGEEIGIPKIGWGYADFRKPTRFEVIAYHHPDSQPVTEARNVVADKSTHANRIAGEPVKPVAKQAKPVTVSFQAAGEIKQATNVATVGAYIVRVEGHPRFTIQPVKVTGVGSCGYIAVETLAGEKIGTTDYAWDAMYFRLATAAELKAAGLAVSTVVTKVVDFNQLVAELKAAELELGAYKAAATEARAVLALAEENHAAAVSKVNALAAEIKQAAGV